MSAPAVSFKKWNQRLDNKETAGCGMKNNVLPLQGGLVRRTVQAHRAEVLVLASAVVALATSSFGRAKGSGRIYAVTVRC